MVKSEGAVLNGDWAKGARCGDKKLQKTAFLQNWGQTGVKSRVIILLIGRETKLKQGGGVLKLC